MWKKALLPFLIFLIIFSGCGWFIEKTDYAEFIRSYAYEHESFTLSEIVEIDFEWDIAYVDKNYFSQGEYPAQKYGLDLAKLEPLSSEETKRLLFYNENKLVQEVYYTRNYIYFPDFIEVVYPETIFYSLPWSEKSVKLSAYNNIGAVTTPDNFGGSYSDDFLFLLSDTKTSQYTNADTSSSGHRSMKPSLLQVYALFEENILKNVCTNYLLFYKSPNNPYDGNYDIGTVKVGVGYDRGIINSIESFLGDESITPFQANNPIEDYHEKMGFSIDALSDFLISALSSDENLASFSNVFPTSNLCFEIGNDGSDYMQCIIEIDKNPSNILQLEWRYEENIWKYVK